MGKYEPDYYSPYYSEPAKSGGGVLVWLVGAAIVLAFLGYYGATQGWFAATGSLSGVVIDERNTPITIGTLRIAGADGSTTYSAHVGSDGTYNLLGIKPGTYMVTLVTPYGTYPNSFEVFITGRKENKVGFWFERSWFTEQEARANKPARRRGGIG